ncbi:MAG: NAD(P)/FAD-dependent oxidoreductase [Planctomycetia bacterium]
MSAVDPAPDLLVVGAGLAGLACALRARELGLAPRVLEAGDEVGGRVRTDEVEGFRLDRGFQVLLTAYPALAPWLPGLDPKPFAAGARVHWQGGFHGLFDPRRHPLKALGSLLGGPGSLGERLRLLRLARQSAGARAEALLEAGEGSAADELDRRGIAGDLRRAFVQPWLAGIFLEPTLATPAAWMQYVLHMFAHGRAALPARGMGELPRLMASRLPPGSVRLGARVARVEPGAVTLEGGERLQARAVVLATEQPAAQRLLGQAAAPAGRGVTCHYFAAGRDPLGGEPVLVLDGDGTGPVNNLCVPSSVSAALAPAGAALVSCTVLGLPAGGEAAQEEAVRAQLRGWFGPQVEGWRRLRSYRIEHALPARAIAAHRGPRAVAPGLWLAGDHVETASIQGALASGARAAEQVVAGR